MPRNSSRVSAAYMETARHNAAMANYYANEAAAAARAASHYDGNSSCCMKLKTKYKAKKLAYEAKHKACLGGSVLKKLLPVGGKTLNSANGCNDNRKADRIDNEKMFRDDSVKECDNECGKPSYYDGESDYFVSGDGGVCDTNRGGYLNCVTQDRCESKCAGTWRPNYYANEAATAALAASHYDGESDYESDYDGEGVIDAGKAWWAGAKKGAGVTFGAAKNVVGALAQGEISKAGGAFLDGTKEAASIGFDTAKNMAKGLVGQDTKTEEKTEANYYDGHEFCVYDGESDYDGESNYDGNGCEWELKKAKMKIGVNHLACKAKAAGNYKHYDTHHCDNLRKTALHTAKHGEYDSCRRAEAIKKGASRWEASSGRIYDLKYYGGEYDGESDYDGESNYDGNGCE